LDEVIDQSGFQLEKVKLCDQNQWSVTGGVLSHFSSGFFQVAGAINRATREEHLVLFQPQGALTGLVLFKDGSEAYVLLQARIEPGNSSIGQYGPTIQSTPGNYLQMHGGKKPSYLELFTRYNPDVNAIGNTIQLDLGKRYFQKNKVHSYLQVSRLIETEENMIWVPLRVISQMLGEDNFLNADLRSLISVFDWDLFAGSHVDSRSRVAIDACKDDGALFSANLTGNDEWMLTGIDRLKGWEIGDSGVVDVSGAGTWVDLFRTSCGTREVSEWSQPLLRCVGRGIVVLLMRKVNDRHEFLVSIRPEFGITGQYAVQPSCVIYPEENRENESGWLGCGKRVTQMIQSEEGGRFYKNETIYQVILVEDDVNIDSDQRWVSVDTLKSVLKASNRGSFQLRCVASLVLDVMNPRSVGRGLVSGARADARPGSGQARGRTGRHS
jgi:oxidase EvaA